MNDKKYFDSDGNLIMLEQLCREEPEWAANMVRAAELANEKLDIIQTIIIAYKDTHPEPFREIWEIVKD